MAKTDIIKTLSDDKLQKYLCSLREDRKHTEGRITDTVDEINRRKADAYNGWKFKQWASDNMDGSELEEAKRLIAKRLIAKRLIAEGEA